MADSLQFSFLVGGVLTNATSVVLSDPTATYGVKRLDTDATVVAAGTAMTTDATGVYRYDLPDVDGAKVSWWAEIVYNGVTYHFERETDTAEGDLADGDYTNETLMRAYAGKENLDIYGDVEGNEAEDDIRQGIQSGIDMAESFTNRLARVAGHTVIPLTLAVSADFPYLQGLVTKLAIAETYFKRAKRDNVDESAPVYGTYGVMTGLKKEAEAKLREFFAGPVDGSGVTVSEPGTFQNVPLVDSSNRCWPCDENGCN